MRTEVNLIEVVGGEPTKIKLGSGTYLLINMDNVPSEIVVGDERYLLINVKNADMRHVDVPRPEQPLVIGELFKPPKHENGRRVSDDIAGFDKNYNRNVRKGDIELIKNILHGERLTIGALLEKTGIGLAQMRATLHYMKGHNMLLRRRHGPKNGKNRNQVVYRLADVAKPSGPGKKQRKLRGIAGFDTTYNYHVRREAIKTVKDALRGAKAPLTRGEIMEKTGIGLVQMRATLHNMKQHGMLIRKHCNHKGRRHQVTYRLVG